MQTYLTNIATSPMSISGVVFLLVSALLYYKPPKKINWYYGYRTTRSMQSQKAWDFAQRYSAKVMAFCAVVMLVIGSIIAIFSYNTIMHMYLDLGVILGAVIVMLYKTEQQLKAKF